MSYTLNPWETLTGYCEDGRLHISNALAESASCFSFVETAEANGLEPYAYLEYILQPIAAVGTMKEKYLKNYSKSSQKPSTFIVEKGATYLPQLLVRIWRIYCKMWPNQSMQWTSNSRTRLRR